MDHLAKRFHTLNERNSIVGEPAGIPGKVQQVAQGGSVGRFTIPSRVILNDRDADILSRRVARQR